jgi:hypothetical protein
MTRHRTAAALADPDASLAATLTVLEQQHRAGRRRMLKQLGASAALATPLPGVAAVCAITPT